MRRKMPPGVPFPQFSTALTDGTDKPDLHLRSGIAIIPPRLALPSSGERAALARRKRGAFVRKRVKASFDPKEFLAKVGEGKTISEYRKDQSFFHRKRSRTRFFTSSKARSSSPSFPSKARKRSLQSWGPVTFLAKDV